MVVRINAESRLKELKNVIDAYQDKDERGEKSEVRREGMYFEINDPPPDGG